MWEYYNMFCWFLQSVPVIFYNRGARLTSPVFFITGAARLLLDCERCPVKVLQSVHNWNVDKAEGAMYSIW